MATAEAVKKELAKTEIHPVRKMLQESVKDFDRKRREKFERIAYSFIRSNPDILKCESTSLLGAFMVATQLDLEPVAGQAYILPFNQSEKKTDGTWHTIKRAQFVLGFRGAVSLFYRHAKGVQLSWGVVRENDAFDMELGSNEFLRHVPASIERGGVLGYWVMATLSAGGKPFHYMTKDDCIAHGKKHSKTYDKKADKFFASSPWATNEEAMCLKTCLLQLSKLLPLSVEIQGAMQADESSRDFRQGVENALELPNTTEWDNSDRQPEEGKSDDVLVDSVSLTEWQSKDAWKIATKDSKIYWTDRSEIADLAFERAKSGEVFKIFTEKREPGLWIVETVK